MPDLLLLSNSRAPGMGFLEHATDAVKGVLGDRASVLFVPFAGSDPDGYTATMRAAHQGETRQQRLEEFLEENDVPVLGLREGSWLAVSGRRAMLAGASTARLFRRDTPPAEVPAGTDLSFLLQVTPHFDTGT